MAARPNTARWSTVRASIGTLTGEPADAVADTERLLDDDPPPFEPTPLDRIPVDLLPEYFVRSHPECYPMTKS